MMEFSRALPIPQISPRHKVKSGVDSIDPSDTALAKEFPCPDDYVDAPEDQIDCVPSPHHDVVEIFDPCSDEIPLNVQIMSRVLEDQRVLRFNCLGDIVPQNYISGPSMPVAALLRRVLRTCCAKFVSVTDERLPFRMKQQFMNSLFETRILLSRFLVIYRFYRQCRIPQSLQSQMTDEVMRPGLVNSRNTCYVHAFVQFLFHILDLRLMIVAWLNRDPILSALRPMFVTMSQNRPIDAISLSTVCEPDVLDGIDCSQLALQILGALRDASSGMLRDTIEQLFCFRQTTRFSTGLRSRCVPD
jgi:hypothetical protein